MGCCWHVPPNRIQFFCFHMFSLKSPPPPTGNPCPVCSPGSWSEMGWLLLIKEWHFDAMKNLWKGAKWETLTFYCFCNFGCSKTIEFSEEWLNWNAILTSHDSVMSSRTLMWATWNMTSLSELLTPQHPCDIICRTLDIFPTCDGPSGL